MITHTKKTGLKRVTALALVFLCLCSFVGCNSTRTTIKAPADYDALWTLGNRRVSFSSFLFPTSIDTSNVISFGCEHETSFLLGARWQAVLELQYDSESFAFEKDKIKALCAGSVIYGESEYFDRETYASVWNTDGCYEYAIFDSDKNTVSYVYLQHKEKKDITLDSSLIPNGYEHQMKGAEFSIY